MWHGRMHTVSDYRYMCSHVHIHVRVALNRCLERIYRLRLLVSHARTCNGLSILQMDVNKSLADRYATSWSVHRGHHFYLWSRKPGSTAQARTQRADSRSQSAAGKSTDDSNTNKEKHRSSQRPLYWLHSVLAKRAEGSLVSFQPAGHLTIGGSGHEASSTYTDSADR